MPVKLRRSGRKRSLSNLYLTLQELESRDVPVTVPTGFAYFPVVNTGLASPAALEVTPDGRVFVALQNGTIRVVQNDQLLNDPLVVLNAQVDSVWERGLLGITLDPQFTTNGYIYVYYTANAPTSHNRISRLTVSGNAVVPGSESIIYELPDIGGAIYHMGGALHFGPDGKLYVSVGDHQVPNTAQSMTSLFGKVLRFNVDGTIPTDNPFYSTATGDYRAIWALGLRNPFTKAFDPVTGKLFINDVGNTAWEEVNAGTPGANFGWPTTEGNFNQGTYPNFTLPFHTYAHGPDCAITGGAFYSPTTYVFPAVYHGKYFFADFCAGWIKTLDPNTAAVGSFATGTDYPIDLRVSSSGALYFITRGAQTGGQPNTGGIGKIAYIDEQAPTITLQPSNVLVSTGETATFNVQAAGTPTLSYQWERSLSGTTTWAAVPGATSATLTVTSTPLSADGDRYRAVVTNTFGTATSNPATLSVTSNVRPTATILSPINGIFYNAGNTINFSGLGTDPEDGSLPPSAYHWQVDNYTGSVPRPVELPNNGTGYTSGSFTIPTDGIYKPANVFYRIFLTVTDSGGLSKTTFVEIYPNTSVVTLNSQPASLGLMLDDQPIPSPTSFTGVVGFNRLIEAPLFAANGISTYQFASWSDGGARQHVIATPAVNTTYTASYQPISATFVSDLPFVGTPVNGWGPVERDRSNGETGAADGNVITLQGTTYSKGLGVHADSEVIFNLAGQYGAFLSDVGMDDEVGANGSVVFQVWVDGVKLFDSGTMTGSSATKSVIVDVTNKNQLRLVVTTAGDGNGSDHADWAGARLTAVPPSGVPNAPVILQAQPLTGGQISLAWSDSTASPNSADGYFVEQSSNGTTGWTQIAEVSPNLLATVAAELNPGTTYFFRVRGHNSLGYSVYSSVSSATTTTSIDHAIDYADGFSEGALALNGTAAVMPVSSRLRLSTLGTGNTVASAFHIVPQNIAAFSTSFTYIKNGNAEGVTFTLQRDPRGETAIGGGGDHLGYGAPNAITPSLALAINISAAHPRGTEFLSNGNVDYNYTQSTIDTAVNNPITVTLNYIAGILIATIRQGANVETKSYAVDLPALLGGPTAYVGFTGAASASSATQEIMYWTFDQGLAPAAPTSVQGTLTGYSASSTASTPMVAHLTWNAAAGASGYKIERKLSSGGTYTQIGTATGTGFDDPGLTSGTDYFYRIRAYNAIGDGPYSIDVPVATPAVAPAPSNPGISTVTTSAITFHWTDNADNEDGFQILRSVGPGPFALLVALPPSFAAAPSVATYTDATATPGTIYNYRVQAFNLSGNSNFVSLNTAALCLPPNGLTATALPGQIALNWSAPNGALSYSIYRGTSPDGQSPTPIATGVTTLTYTDTGLTAGVTYYYTITAVNAGGESVASGETSAAPIDVQSLLVNGGDAQRSRITSIQVNFNAPVNVASLGTIALTRTTPSDGAIVDAGSGLLIAPASGMTSSLTLTFANALVAGVEYGSLADGRWQLTISGLGYASPLNDPNLRRLFGDINNDGTVDGAVDFPAFGATFNDSTILAFDFNNDGIVEGAVDFPAFGARFGESL